LREINPSLRVIGFTATPYRLGHGLITDGDAMFKSLIEPISILELIELGHLAPLKSKLTDTELSTAGVKKRGGEFIAKQLQEAVDTVEQNNESVDESIKLAGERKAWLFFCAGVTHAQNIRAILQDRGIKAECITGDTPKAERARILNDFKSGAIKAVTNANVLTTGFDYPDIDLLVFLRPTESKSLYVQMAGRGMRPKSHTDHCLVLDFAGVVTRHGPITFVQAEDGPSDKKKDDEDEDEEAPSKSCPMCKEINSIRAKECAECGELFPVIEKKILSLHSSTDIMGLKPNVMPVSSWAWSVHTSKKTGVDMIKITYYSPVLSDPLVSEYLCLLHDGYAQKKALGVLRSLCDGSGTAPDNETLDSLCYQFNNVKPPGELHYIKAGKFYKIVSHDFSIEPTPSNLLEMLF